MSGGDDIVDGKGEQDYLLIGSSCANFSITTLAGVTKIKGLNGSGDFYNDYITSVNSEIAIFNTSSYFQDRRVNLTTSPYYNIIQGQRFSETLTGTSEDDYFDSFGGNDKIDGGEGKDTLLVFAERSLFDITTLAGMTKVYGKSGSGVYQNNTITLTKVEKIEFSDEAIALVVSPYNIIQGNTYSETLTGTSEDDYFDSFGGNDTIDGGEGKDTLLVFAERSLFDITTLAGMTKVYGKSGSGVYQNNTITLTKVEKIEFSDLTLALETSSNSIIQGNTYSETLTGTSEDDYFDSFGGNDTIDGGAGTDTLLIFENRSLFDVNDLGSSGVTTISCGPNCGVYSYDEITVTNIEKVQFADEILDLNTPISGEILVNTTVTNQQNEPKVAVLSDDTFVVVWKSPHLNQNGSNHDIFGQRFNRQGQKLGEEFKVNSCSESNPAWDTNHWRPDVSALEPDGNWNQGFVVTWIGIKGCSAQGSGSEEVFAQVYDMSGNVLSDDFGVGLDFAVDQGQDAAARYDPKVTFAYDSGSAAQFKGGFVITYLKNSPSYNADGGAELYHQSFDERAGFRQGLDKKLATGEGK